MDARAAQETGSAEATPWRLLTLLTAMTAIGPVTLNILVPALPRLATVLEADIGTVQLTLSLFLLSLAGAQLVLGALSERFGRRPVVLAGLVLATLASFAAIAAPSAGWLVAARVAQALGAATGIVVGRAIIRDLYSRDRAAAMLGLVTTAMVLGPMLAPAIGGVLDTAFGWRAIFVFVALLTLTVLLWAVWDLPETRPERPPGPSMLGRDCRALAASAPFIGYVLAIALGTIPFFAFIGGGPHVVVSIMGRSSAEYGFWFMVTSAGYMSGNFIASRISQQIGAPRMVMAGLLLEAAGGCVMVAVTFFIPAGGPAVIFLPQLLVSVGNGIMMPNAMAGAVSVRPDAAGTASGIVGFTQWAIGALAAQLVTLALVHATTPLPMALIICLSVMVAAAVFPALVRR
jgi:DHA1 family bicyclomycin/chloramphenicol resistance-like MFS transporter